MTVTLILYTISRMTDQVCVVYRWGIAMVVAASAFISTCGSSIIAPAIHAMTRDLVGPNGNEQLGILVTSVYVLGMGCVPAPIAPRT